MTDAPEDNADDMADGAFVPPDPGVSLDVRFPMVLGSAHRNPGGMVMIGWAADTGEAVFARRFAETPSPQDAQYIVEKLDRYIPLIVVAAYDGDDGRIVMVHSIRLPDPHENGHSFAVVDEEMAPMLDNILSQTDADPDQPCPICDESVLEGTDIDRHKAHRECLLANIIGPLGHHLDHAFWCENMGDPTAGLGARGSALRLAALVDRYGLEAVIAGTFPKDDVTTS